jgi:hypothetical protein
VERRRKLLAFRCQDGGVDRDFFGGKVDEVATDDLRRTAACHRFCDSFGKSDRPGCVPKT